MTKKHGSLIVLLALTIEIVVSTPGGIVFW